METFLQTYVSFIICILLYFTYSHNAICYGREVDYSSQLTSSLLNNSIKASSFDVRSYGAKGDGVTNDAGAFQTAWNAACKSNGGVMIVPSGYTFLLQPITLNGNSCQSKVVVQIDGKIVAPNKPQWSKIDLQLILFSGMGKGITIQGNGGTIDGRGDSWWSSGGNRPHALRIVDSSNVTVTGIKVLNAPRMHVFIDNSQYVRIFNVTVSSPGNSPNTDGIHLTHAQHVEIHSSNIACGDDCISIQTGSQDVKIHNVDCGPGHGYSIGGLSANKTESQVSDISVYDSTVSNALNGVRIKTWPDGYGFVRNVTYSNIKMKDVHMPINIDQNYCGGPHTCPTTSTNAVAISGVSYWGITGTYTNTPVSLDCSKYKPCRGLTFSSINLTQSASGNIPKGNPFCSNAYGRVLTSTTPPLYKCLLSEAYYQATAPAPAMAPNQGRIQASLWGAAAPARNFFLPFFK
ncbi:hypothetical protein ACP275_08G010300 [Erythranthe tilingii]